jgi:hypothetical protein
MAHAGTRRLPLAVSRIDARQLTWAAGAMLATAAALPALPGNPGLPCPLRTITGVPCPFCGMTTSVEATVHLNVGDALAANPAGIGLVIFAVVLLVLRPKSIPVPITLAGATLALMWAFELQRFGFF